MSRSATAAAPAAVAQHRVPRPIWLSTRRLQLRELYLGDALLLLNLDRSERVQRLLLDDHVSDLREACAVILWLQELYREQPGLGLWHARLHDRYPGADAGRFVGVFSLMPVADSTDVEIGARLLPRYWGRNLPLEAGRALCEHAFTTLSRPRVVGLLDPDNRGAEAVMRRLGFHNTGRCTHFGKPALRYALERGEWLARRSLAA